MDAIGPYRIVRRLGGGPFSSVHECRRDGRTVALKLFRPSRRRQRHALRRRQADPVPDWRRAFEWEAALLATFDHPAIVPVLDQGVTEDEAPYFVMPYFIDTIATRMWGTNLPKKSANPLPRDLALSILRDTLSGVAILHGRGVVHRDLKPQNILIAANGNAAICDLGQALSADDGTALPLKSPGTYPYVAPELRDAPDTVDGRADIFAIGLIGHLMLVGELPDDGQKSYKRLPSGAVRNWIAAALRPDAAERPRDGSALATAVTPPK